MLPKKYHRIGMVARWQPVHLGHAAILKALCNQAETALIGIGSSNKHNLRTPFTLEETRRMIELTLTGRENYSILPVPDLGNGPKWRLMVRDLFGELDLFVTNNPYVQSLMCDIYPLIQPAELVAEEDKIPLDGSMVRRVMASNGDWQSLVPSPVARYILENNLDKRFRAEFGLQTLALDTYLS